MDVKNCVRSFYDGFFVGADLIGFGWHILSKSKRPVGYNALYHSLNYPSLGDDTKHALEPLSSNVRNRTGLLENALCVSGAAVGGLVNYSTLGLVNVMLIGQVYSKE